MVTVQEGNLRFQVASLRRALRKERERIKTIPGRGYLFVAGNGPARSVAGTRRATRRMAGRPPIAIIEGDPEVRARLSRLLESAGARVENFDNVSDFLAGSEIVSGSARAPTGGGDRVL